MIGLVPAAGDAERAGGLPKFLWPINMGNNRIGSLLDVLEERMARAGATRFLIGTKPKYMGLFRSNTGREIIYPAETKTMNETINLAHGLISEFDELILCGLPDGWWAGNWPVYQDLLDVTEGYTVSVAVFRTLPHHRHLLGMCEIETDERGIKIVSITDHPKQTELTWAWGALIFDSAFWQYIDSADPHIGFAVQRAINDGWRVPAVCIDTPYYNCNTLAVYDECLNASFEQGENE